MKIDILGKIKHELKMKNVVFITVQNRTFMINDFNRNHLMKIEFIDLVRMKPVQIDIINSSKNFDDIIRFANDEEILKCINENKEK